MKRFLRLFVGSLMVLMLCGNAMAFNVPIEVVTISSQTLGAGASLYSTTADMGNFTEIKGFFSLAHKCDGSGTPDCKWEIVCYSNTAADTTVSNYITPSTSASGGTITEDTGVITSSTNTDFTTPTNPQVTEIDMPLCEDWALKVTNSAATTVYVHGIIIAQ